MSSGLRAVALVAAAMSSLACVSMRVSAAESGVNGTVTVSPARPGPQVAGEPSARPLSGVEVQLRDAAGTIVARANADSNGEFHILVPAGQYELHIDTHHGHFPRCQGQSLQVADGLITHVDIACDSGMR
jgi:hypothetical protein